MSHDRDKFRGEKKKEAKMTLKERRALKKEKKSS
jgi:hypothetical protein